MTEKQKLEITEKCKNSCVYHSAKDKESFLAGVWIAIEQVDINHTSKSAKKLKKFLKVYYKDLSKMGDGLGLR